jgi:hypothetical protein
MTNGVSSVPAGWYANPENESEWRWWDGLTWTDSTRPMRNTDTGAVQRGAPGGSLGQAGFTASGVQSGSTTVGLKDGSASTGPQPSLGPGQASGTGHVPSVSGAVTPALGSQNGPPDRMRPGSIPAMIFGVVMGLVIVGVGLLMGHASDTPANETASVAARVISVSFSPGGNCIPTASFSYRGAKYTATSSQSSNCKYFVGETVTVRYDPSDAKEASVPPPGSTKLFSWLFVAAGALFALVFLLLSLRIRSRIAAGTYVPRTGQRGVIRIGGERQF